MSKPPIDDDYAFDPANPAESKDFARLARIRRERPVCRPAENIVLTTRRDATREAFLEACRAKPEQIVAERPDLGPLPFQSPIPRPSWRPDPEAVLVSDLRGGAGDIADVTGRPKVIRRVGPRFFPDQ